MSPYIKLIQSKIEPKVLQEVIDIYWYYLDERKQQQIMDVLNEAEVQYEY